MGFPFKYILATKLRNKLQFNRWATTLTEAEAVFHLINASERVRAATLLQVHEGVPNLALDLKRFDEDRAHHVLEDHTAVGNALRFIVRPKRCALFWSSA